MTVAAEAHLTDDIYIYIYIYISTLNELTLEINPVGFHRQRKDSV
jgi:hypothetical protein